MTARNSARRHRSARRRFSARPSTPPASSACRPPTAGSQARGFPVMADGAELPGPRHRPALAFLLRLALRHQRAGLSRRQPPQPPCLARPRADLGELRGIGRSILDHMRLRFDHGRDYNVLQKLTYLGLIFVVLPLVVLAGLTMSPGHRCRLPVAGRRFRRPADGAHHPFHLPPPLIVLFVLVHVVMVLISGVWNNIRSMITGRYAIDPRRPTTMALSRSPSRRGLLAGVAATAGAAALSGCDQLSADAVVPERPLHRRGPDRTRCSASSCRRRRWRASSPRPTSRRTSGPTARPTRTIPTYRALAANGFADWQLEGRRPGRDADGVFARRPPRHAVADPDHPPRLRRGLELHRQVDRRAARAASWSRSG